MTRWGALCAGLPGAVVIGALGSWVIASLLHLPPTDASRSLTLPEAAMLADHADVVRLIRGGADPNVPARVRAYTLDLTERVMTPLEASTHSRQAGIVQLLIESGARIDAEDYPALWCSAARVPNNDAVVDFLRAHQPSGLPPIDCPPR